MAQKRLIEKGHSGTYFADSRRVVKRKTRRRVRPSEFRPQRFLDRREGLFGPNRLSCHLPAGNNLRRVFTFHGDRPAPLRCTGPGRRSWGKTVSTIYAPFEKHLCPVTGEESELDPIYGLSLDGLASKHRRDEIDLPIPWALHPHVGFETRFHSKKVSNITFQTLHKGYTKGSMLVCFTEKEAWMRNVGEPQRDGMTNYWTLFLTQIIRNMELTYLSETEEEDEWFNFQFQVLVNGKWISSRPPTVAGSVIDVTDDFEKTVKPCEIPITFRDVDWLVTSLVHADIGSVEGFSLLAEKFFGSLCSLQRLQRLIEKARDVPWQTFQSYQKAGHGVLGCLKGERNRLELNLPIPQLEIRELEPVS